MFTLQKICKAEYFLVKSQKEAKLFKRGVVSAPSYDKKFADLYTYSNTFANLRLAIYKNCGFAIFELAHLINLRICKCRKLPRIFVISESLHACTHTFSVKSELFQHNFCHTSWLCISQEIKKQMVFNAVYVVQYSKTKNNNCLGSD